MKSFAVYDRQGRILHTGAAPEEVFELQAGEGRFVIEGPADWASDYVLAGKVTPRPTSTADLATNLLIGLPTPCTIYINDKAYPCTDTTAELSMPFPGTYRVRVEAFPYLDSNFQLVQS